MCNRAPVSPAKSSARWMASSSATMGLEPRKSRTPRPVARRPNAAVSSWFSACTATGSPSVAASCNPSNSVASSARGNSGRPESHMNALKPTTPLARPSPPSRRPNPARARPICEVRHGGGLERRALAIELARVDGARRRVEGHVEEQRAAAGRESAAPGGRAFPLGPAGLVEVQVHVDHARQDGQALRIDLLRVRRRGLFQSPRSGRFRWRHRHGARRRA